MGNTTNNKLIAKNTAFLYFRMFLLMGISFYTSRVILKVLGISDYGLFNVVGGSVALFAVFASALAGCTQRFITISLGEGIKSKIKKTFQVSLLMHLVVAVVFFVLMEIVGNILIFSFLNVPDGREGAAFFIFHFCLLAGCLELLRALYDAVIIAYERMSFYAYMSIMDAILKLSIIFSLLWVENFDYLKLYAVLYCFSTFVMLLVYATYCIRHFEECRSKPKYDRTLFKEIGIYTSWNTVSHLGFVSSSQGSNFALNYFYGTVLNAAWGVAIQINSVVGKFVSNFQLASQTQIIKLYAEDNIEEMHRLSINVAKYSGYLYMLIGVPLLLEINNILSIWLVEVPLYTSYFASIMIVQGYIGALSNSVTKIITATGRVKSINLVGTCSQLISLFIFIVLLSLGCNVSLAFLAMLIPTVTIYAAALLLSRHYTKLSIHKYILEVWWSNAYVTIIAVILPVFIHFNMQSSIIRIFVVSLLSSTCLMASVYFFGIDCNTRWKLNKYVLNKLHL